MSTKKLQAALRALERLSVADMVGMDAATLAAAAGELRKRLAPPPASVSAYRRLASLSESEMQPTAEERRHCTDGAYISAIKSVRGRTGLCLSDARTLVESWGLRHV